MDDRLVRLESELRGLLRRMLLRLPETEFSAEAIGHHLTQEVANATKSTEAGEIYAPDQYTFSMHPEDVELVLHQLPAFQSELAGELRDILLGLGLHLLREPHVTLATDPTVSRWEVRVFAWRSRNPEPRPKTTRPLPEGEEDRPPPGAFVIVEGKRHFPLTKPMVKIGRRNDNDLILSDPHVSRKHAELRLLAGKYVLVDLGSTGGTYVNGRQVKQHILDPGDVISVAVVQLIYGEDPGGPPRVTPPYTPPRQPAEEHITPHYLKTLAGMRDEDKKH